MPATIVVGGQYGSEGKGKVTALIAAQSTGPIVVRCGGPNSGHTCSVDGTDRILRQLPSAAGQSDATLALAAGCVIDEEVLLAELDACRIRPNRVLVDRRAVLVENCDRDDEKGIVEAIASTGSGTGSALSRRLLRRQGVRLAEHSNRLRGRVTITAVADFLHDAIGHDRKVIVEGTQGFGLSLLHGDNYPHLTSRDTTASGFAMEAGLSPRHINEIVLVIRTFPIRVGGNSGPLADEITWDEVRNLSGAPATEPEFTSVTKTLRRVARFDLELVRRACQFNQPTSLAVMGIDRIDHNNRRLDDKRRLSPAAHHFLEKLEADLGVPVDFIGTGFQTREAICPSLLLSS